MRSRRQAVVSTGNANKLLPPAMEKIIGYPEPVEVIAGGFSGLTVGGHNHNTGPYRFNLELGFGYYQREY